MMFSRPDVGAALLAALVIFPPAQVQAQGKIVITQAKALAGNVTPGDKPGFPITLDGAGPYVFESNVYAPAGKNGIEIQPGYGAVDIDFNGFSLSGERSGSGMQAFAQFLRIHGGTISGFGTGILSSNPRECESIVIEDMWITSNKGRGIDARHCKFHSVINSKITYNGHDGISCGRECSVSGSRIYNNVAAGIRAVSGLIVGNVITRNGGGLAAVDLINGAGIIKRAPHPVLDGDWLGDSADFVGYGNNFLAFNNHYGEGPQVIGATQLSPNICVPACPEGKKKKK